MERSRCLERFFAGVWLSVPWVSLVFSDCFVAGVPEWGSLLGRLRRKMLLAVGVGDDVCGAAPGGVGWCEAAFSLVALFEVAAVEVFCDVAARFVSGVVPG